MTADATLSASRPQEALDILLTQRSAWERRPLLRRLYRNWFVEIQRRLSAVAGASVELGAGCGAFKEFMPAVLATDVIPTPWAERVADAEQLPFDDSSLANLVMFDVFHHVTQPAAALREAERTLTRGGRVVMVEPFCSPIALLAYRYLHHEHADLRANPECPFPQSGPHPLDANIALPTLLFWRRADLLRRWTPRLRLVERERLAWLVYPLSGGFSKPQLLPSAFAGPALALERILAPALGPLVASRCLIVVEKVR